MSAKTISKIAFMVLLAGCMKGGTAPSAPAGTSALRSLQPIPLPGTEGRFDHFAVDVKGKRLFVAALGNNSLEVIDLAESKRVKTIAGLRKPTGVAFLPAAGRVAVGCGEEGSCRIYDASTWELIRKIDNLDDADNVRFDAEADRLYVGYGGGALAVIDAKTNEKIADVKLAGHPESFQLEPNGDRIFVNVPEAGHVAVVDRRKGAVVQEWKLDHAAANFPMALDAKNGRLFIGCRQPAKVVVLDVATGKSVTSIECVQDTDDLFYDAETRRLYVSGGGGAISTIQQTDPDHYERLADIPTAAGARTSFFVPDLRRLYVAVPHRGKQLAELRVFEVDASEK